MTDQVEEKTSPLATIGGEEQPVCLPGSVNRSRQEVLSDLSHSPFRRMWSADGCGAAGKSCSREEEGGPHRNLMRSFFVKNREV
jgi:hypothetical protein